MSNLTEKDIELRDEIVEYFKTMNSVPRPSYHEEKVGEIIYNWAKENDFEVIKDKAGNLIIDIPATNGSTEEPKILMQGHMDMVSISEDPDFDPINTPIKTIVDEEKGIMYAEGTSLGADNALGVAMAMKAAVDDYEHDALRIIVTVGEEVGFVGTSQLDPKHLESIRYLLNLDHSEPGESVVSCAGNAVTDFRKPCKLVDAELPCGYSLNITNTKGGHSGNEIHENRINAIKEIVRYHQSLLDNGVDFELSETLSEHASNAIPSDATIKINIKKEDEELCNKLLEEWEEHLNSTYKESDQFELNHSIGEPSSRVFCKEDRDIIMGFLAELPAGVAKFVDGGEILESSNNLASVVLEDGDVLHITSSSRGITAEATLEQVDINVEIAKKYGFATEVQNTAVAWFSERDSKLNNITNKVWKDISGDELVLVDIHAGIENGALVAMNPEIQAISIGPKINDLHSVKEIAYINSLPDAYRHLRGIIEELS